MKQDQQSEDSAVPARRALGRYRIIDQIGRGGMADVHLAVSSGPAGFSKLHVLKLLRRESFDNDQAVHMFAAEARLSVLLNHPNVVQVFEVGEDEGAVFMVMEYLEGQSLRTVIRQMQRTEGDRSVHLPILLRIIAEVLNGLHYAHELRDLEGGLLNIVHRDVTPHNVFVTYDGGIKLLDFGVAKTASSSTEIGTIKGKLGYLAPEQVASPALVDRRTDVFQCGLMLWEALLGRRLWEGMKEREILATLVHEALPPLELPAEADPDLVRICQKATAFRQADRFETAELFNRALESFMTSRDMRWTAKDVGSYVATLFAECRAQTRETVRARLQQVQRAVSSGLDSIRSGPISIEESIRTEGESSGGIGRLYGRLSQSSHPDPPGSGTSFPVPLPRRRWITAAAFSGALLVLLGLSARLFSSGALATNAGALPPPAPSASQVRLLVDTVPSGARLFVDGVPTGVSPLSTVVDRDGRGHLVRADLQGYEPMSVTVTFDREERHLIRLVPGAPPLTSSASPSVLSKAVETSAPRTRAALARGRPTASPVAAARTPTAVGETLPAVVTTSRPNEGRAAGPKIDSVDPWQ